MKKQFKTEEELREWIQENFSPKSIEEMISRFEISAEEIIEKLLEDGYTDLNNLVEDGHAYQIGTYSNNGWLYEDEVDFNYLQITGKKLEIRKRSMIKKKREELGISRAELSRRLEIPMRTLQNWEIGENNPPKWAEKLILEKLENMKKEGEKR